MASTTQLLFLDASPLNTPQAQKANRARAYAHAARKSHERRIRSLESAARQLVQHNTMCMHLDSPDSPSGQLFPNGRPYTPFCQGCDTRSTLVYDNGASILVRNCERNARRNPVRRQDRDPVQSLKVPSARPGWAHQDTDDLQFYMEVFGASLEHYSDSGFFNIVVPCLSDFDQGIRNLVLAVASTHREAVTAKDVEARENANVQALERCNRGIHYLAKQPATASLEVLQTSCILLVCLHMLQRDMKAAATYIQVAQKLCRMDQSSRSIRRFSFARNVTQPQAQQRYMASSFGSIIAGTVAKSAVEIETWPSHSTDSLPSTESAVEYQERLTIDPLVLRHPISDVHDLLGSLENMVPVFQQLIRNITYSAAVDSKSLLARDLMARFREIFQHLRTADITTDRMRSAIRSLLTACACMSTGVHCQVMSRSEMVWDEHLDSFQELLHWTESDLSKDGGEDTAPFLFLPFTSIVVKPVWFTAVHCRDPVIRRGAIALLLRHHRNESGVDSWVAGHVAATLMQLEEAGRAIENAADVKHSERVILRGFEYDDDGVQLYLLYTRALEIDLPDLVALRRQPLSIDPDPHGIVRVRNAQTMLDYLSTLYAYVAQPTIDKAPHGYVKPIWYDGQPVPVIHAAGRVEDCDC